MPVGDAAVVAKLIRRSPAHVRKLVRDGLLTPLPTLQKPKRGRPRMMFDLQAVTKAVRITPSILGPLLDITERDA